MDLPVAGTVSPSILRCRILAPYVPLRTKCSESVPAAGRSISAGSASQTEFCKGLFLKMLERNLGQ